MTEEIKEKSTTRKIEEELEVLVQISSEIQKQLDKGECKLPGFKEAADYLGCSHSSRRNVGTGEVPIQELHELKNFITEVPTSCLPYQQEKEKKGEKKDHPSIFPYPPTCSPLSSLFYLRQQNRRIF